MNKTGRFSNSSDTHIMEYTPGISINSYDAGVREIVYAVWVRERADLSNPGSILGKRDLQQEGVIPEARTTGGDLINLQRPTIAAPASKFFEVVNHPMFIQTSDGIYYKAVSPGKLPEAGTAFVGVSGSSFVALWTTFGNTSNRGMCSLVSSIGASILTNSL